MPTARRLAALLLASVAVPAPAHADPTAPAAAPSDSPPAATPDDGQTGIQDVVVTATRRETNLQRTPVAISVVDDVALRDRHVQSLYDLADGGVPSLRVATFEARQSALTVGIRGIVPLDANQPAREQGVGIYVDGIYLGRQHGLNAALFDVERIEVLKGPQGTLFGRNTEGGALNIVTKAPAGRLEGRVVGGVGNYGSRNAELHLSLPARAGVSVKLDAISQHQDATTRNPLPGQIGWNYFDRHGLRAAVRWQPIEGLTDDLSYDKGIDRNSPFYSQLLNFNPNACAAGSQAARPRCYLPGTAYLTLTGTVKPLLPGVVVNGTGRMRTADIGVPQRPSVDETHGFTNVLRYHLSDAVELRSLTAWRGVDATQWDNSGGAHRVPTVTLTAACTAASPCAFSRYSLADLHQRQFSQELQAVGTAGPVDYVAGLYYFHEHVEDDAATPSSNGAIATLNAAGQVVGATYTAVPFCTGQTVVTTGAFIGAAARGCAIDRASEVWSKSHAAYGQLTFNATDALHLTVGGRYTHDTKRGVLHISRNVDYDVNGLAAAAAGYRPLDRTWNRFNPTATIAYEFADTVHGYAKYATGYRSGGASSRTANYQAFGPEDIRSYELGLKTDLFGHRLRLNLAGYIMDRKNSQVDISSIQPFNGSSFNNLVTINTPGITRIRGVEADLTMNPVDGLTLTASYAYTYTRIPPIPITYTVGGASTTVDQRFFIVFTPRNAASGAIDYQLPVVGGVRVRFHLDANYAQATSAFDQFATPNDASFLVNGRVALADIGFGGDGPRATLSFWARNLFDEQHVYRRDPSNSLPGAPTTSVTAGSISNVLGDYGNFNAPRTYGAEVSIAF